jgi:hypothetical protein
MSAPSVAGVRLEPSASRVDWSDGPYLIRIELSDLEHYGRIPYDDDRDTVPDRQEPSEGLGAFEFVLTYNPDVLEVTEVQGGDFIGSAGRTAQCFQRIPELGQYAFACASTGSAPGAQGEGTLATITLVPLTNGASFLELEVDLAGPLGDGIEATVEGGIVEVLGAPESAPTPEPDPTQDGDGMATPVDPVDDPTPELPDLVDGGPVSSPSTEGDQLASASLPSTGMAGEPSRAAGSLLALGGVLAAGGLVLLFGSRLAARSRRS